MGCSKKKQITVNGNEKNSNIFNRNNDDDNNKWSDADRASKGIGGMCLPNGTGRYGTF